MIQAHATARYVRTSAQKAGLVLDLIRGKDVNRALATLQFVRKAVAQDIAKVVRSAIANAQQQQGFSGDVDRLYVSACFANQGPSLKRVRPAPMGRAFRVLKRTTHLTIKVSERPEVVVPAASVAAPAGSRQSTVDTRKSSVGSRQSTADRRPARAKKGKTKARASARTRTTKKS
jgi:large subunit ribosomal protein L22